MAKKDYYQILNVDHKSSLKQIKSAFRQLALKYHPDHNPGNLDAAQLFSQIKEAYEFLSTPELRKQYDSFYKPRTAPAAERQPQAAPKSSTATRPKKSQNLRYTLFITLEDVVTGCERGIRYIRNNKNEKETVQLKVKVPVGAYHLQRLKLSGYGDVDTSGAGDLFVIVQHQNHPMFLKNDLNLRVNVPVSYIDIALGSTLEVPTLTGIRKLKLKSCEFEDLDTTLRGFGLPDHEGRYKGDLEVHFFIEHPKKLSNSEKEALESQRRSWPQGEMMQQYQVYLKNLKGRSS